MDTKTLQSAFTSQLKPAGFRKKGASWYREANRMLHVINLQHSSFGPQYYLNLCIVPTEMKIEGMPTPKQYKCPISLRFGNVFPAFEKEMSKLLDFEYQEIEDEVRIARVSDEINSRILPFFESLNDEDSLKKAIAEEKIKICYVDGAARKYLGI
jgi:Domain of unknown function (DUF4304)